MAENPYAQFDEKPEPSDNPYSQFGEKHKEPSVGLADFFKSIPRGILGGAVGAASAMGQAEAPLTQPPEMAAGVPGQEQSTELAEQNLTGSMHKPDTRWGRYGATTGEFLGNPGTYLGPGRFIPKAVTAVTGALGSEAGGQLTEGTKWEPVGRLVGAIAGTNAPSAAQRIITPQRGRIPVMATPGESERSLTPAAFKKGLRPNWEREPAQIDVDTASPNYGGYDPNVPPHPFDKNRDLSASDKVKAWRDFKRLPENQDLLAPGGWKDLVNEYAPSATAPNAFTDWGVRGTSGGQPVGMTIAKPTKQMAAGFDKITLPLASVFGLGEMFGDVGALAGYASSAHAHEGIINPWLRNQLLPNQFLPKSTRQSQALINAMSGNYKRQSDQ